MCTKKHVLYMHMFGRQARRKARKGLGVYGVFRI